MKKTLFILLLSTAALFGVSSCQEMFDDNGQADWEDFQTEITAGTETGTCSGTGTGYHHGNPNGQGQGTGQGTETGTCSGTGTGNHHGGNSGGGHGHHGNNQ